MGSSGAGTNPASDAVATIALPGLHHARQPPNAEDDAVEVRSEDAAVRVVRQPAHVLLAGRDARVQTRELDRTDGFPRVRVRAVEPTGEVKRLHVGALAAQEVDDRGTDPGRTPPSPVQCAGTSGDTDRKRTRLNSSHSQITYAAVCLQQKKN